VRVGAQCNPLNAFIATSYGQTKAALARGRIPNLSALE
jgi:hypothetical protein